MIDNIDFEDLENSETNSSGKALLKRDMALCEHVKAHAEVVACSIEITVGQLFSLREGDVLSARESVASPMTLVVEGKAVATGNLVAVDDFFGFEVLDVAK